MTTSDPSAVPPVLQAPDFLTVGPHQVPCAAVRMVVGEGGVSIDGGEMVHWKRTVVVTDTGRYTATGNAPTCASLYAQYLDRCPHAVGIPYQGDLRMPACPPHADPVAFLGEVITRIQAELHRQSMKALGMAAAGAAITFAALVANVVLFITGWASCKLIILPIIGAVITIMLIARGVNQFLRARRVTQALQALQS